MTPSRFTSLVEQKPHAQLGLPAINPPPQTATHIAVNPKANADNRSLADKEILAIAKFPFGGSRLAEKSSKCWEKR